MALSRMHTSAKADVAKLLLLNKYLWSMLVSSANCNPNPTVTLTLT